MCLDRSVAEVATLLAILKTGACYLPLDPRYPRPRLALMIEDARPALLVTMGEASTHLPETIPPVIDLDAALGQGDNRATILELVRRFPCRVGGGIRNLDTATRRFRK